MNTAVATLLELQRSAGTRLHVLHVSSREAIRMIRAAKAAGRPVTAEANPFAMFITNSWDRVEQGGPYVLGQWVPDQDSEAMWETVVDGTIDVVGSDHAPHTSQEKQAGWDDLYAAPSGSPMIADYLRLLLTAVNDGRLSLERVVELCCTAPARLAGLSGRKGVLTVGADADLVIVDMDHEEVLRNENSPYKCRWTPANGMLTRGRPAVTVRRGTVIAEEGRVLAAAGSGQFLGHG
ncbi:MAG: amidohydrolase family protein [Micromonosporaceae bacterium]|nr:amidohydrolase family protein [Micromonosporaceae bacterium]